MIAQRAAAKAILQDTLQAHDSAYSVREHVYLPAYTGGNRKTIAGVMGSPIRYAEVLYDRPGEDRLSLSGSAGQRRYTFAIQVWHQFEQDNQSQWDDIIEGSDPAGIIPVFASRPRRNGVKFDGLQIQDIAVMNHDDQMSIFVHRLIASITTKL